MTISAPQVTEEASLTRVRDARNKEILAMRAQGMAQKLAVEAMDVNRQEVREEETVATTITAPPKKGRRSKLTPDQKATILQRLAAGEQKKSLAKEYDVSPSTIARVVNRQGCKPPSAKLTQKASTGTTVAHSNSNHSPRLRDLRNPEHPAAMAMQQHKRSYFKALGRLFKELDRADKALLGLQNTLGEDFSKYHGAMLARWAAYEQVWADDLYDQCAAQTFESVLMSLQTRLKGTGKRAKESLSHLERIKTVPITIEE